MDVPFDTWRMRLLRVLWGGAWFLALPLVPLYLLNRARKDVGYKRHMLERFGVGPKVSPGAIWIHAVSLGEVRSAVPLAQALLARGERLLFTNGTPAGRREVETMFSAEMAAGLVAARYLPVEQRWAFRLFLNRIRPKLGLVMEVEFWPLMIATTRRMGVALYLCNGQYPGKSFATDGAFRKSLPSGFAGVMVKSQMMVDRFQAIGCPNIHITGELRFEQPIPQYQVEQGKAVRGGIARPIITFSSVVAGEDDIFLDAIKATPDALFIYVPRAKERFDVAFERAKAASLRVAKRSDCFGPNLELLHTIDDLDVLIGDSYGEMYFYLSLCDQAIIGGGFTAKASHNIIEALALRKPVAVGPNIHTIEYPGEEAIAAGICTYLQTPEDLVNLCQGVKRQGKPDPNISQFLKAHSGAVAKTQAVITSR